MLLHTICFVSNRKLSFFPEKSNQNLFKKMHKYRITHLVRCHADEPGGVSPLVSQYYYGYKSA